MKLRYISFDAYLHFFKILVRLAHRARNACPATLSSPCMANFYAENVIDKLINIVEGCVCECGTYEMLRKLCNFIVMFSTLQYQLKLYSGNFHFSLCLWLHCIVKKCDVFPELNLVVYELKITDCVNNVLRIILLPWMRASNHQRPSGFWY